MAKKDDLRNQREGTVINTTSKRQEKELDRALEAVCIRLGKKFPGITLKHDRQWFLKDVVASLSESFPEVDFHYYHDTSFMKPDGGILKMCAKSGAEYPILIAEKKNQGTNDLRIAEGKGKQAKGNAIERLGKNVIGFRTALLQESIFPFVCFGDGCDFADDSSILDRVVTIAMFGNLNHEYLHNMAGDRFNRGSFFFRVEEWTADEMEDICYSISEKAVYYYYSRVGVIMQDVVMVDIETLGTGPTSVVLSIGVFSPQFTFHEYVDIDSQLTYGAQVNADTILWWMKQREEARLKQTAAVRLRMHVVLCNLYIAFQQASLPDGHTVWSNGASFDLPILRWHADRVGHKLPWEYWQERCYRTERARVPRDRRDEIDAEVTRILGKTVAHDALEDASRQHLWLQLAGVAR